MKRPAERHATSLKHNQVALSCHIFSERSSIVKNKIASIIWISSSLYLGLVLIFGVTGPDKHNLISTVFQAGWPSFIGYAISFALTGSITCPEFEPKKVAEKTTPLLDSNNDAPLKSDPEQEFLEGVKRSKELVASQLENARKKLEAEWENKHAEDLQKVEQKVRLVRQSKVIECCLRIARDTYHWGSWSKNAKGSWNHPDWLGDRLISISVERGSSITLETYNSIMGTTHTETKTSLETAFGFKDGQDEIRQFLYSTGYFDGTCFGRLIVQVNEEVVLDASVSRNIEDEYDEWRYYSGELHTVKPGGWISSIVNLHEEFRGQRELEETQQRLAAQEFSIRKNA